MDQMHGIRVCDRKLDGHHNGFFRPPSGHVQRYGHLDAPSAHRRMIQQSFIICSIECLFIDQVLSQDMGRRIRGRPEKLSKYSAYKLHDRMLVLSLCCIRASKHAMVSGCSESFLLS
jgi:hypothetical protein